MSDRLNLAKIFTFCDKDNKQYLDINDIKIAYVVVFGRKATKFELRELLQNEAGDNLNSTKLNFEEFEKLFGQICNKSDENEEIRNVFTAFDTHSRGFLTEADVTEVFRKVAPHLQEQTIKATFRELDSDNDGRISFRDFDFVLKYSSRD